MSYQLILFDLDGTLLDSSLGVYHSFQMALAKFGGEVAVETLIDKIGPPAPEIFRQLFPEIFTDEKKLKKALRLQRAYYATQGVYESKQYVGMAVMLAELLQAGKILCVATSKPTVYAKKILQHQNLSCYFKTIVGSTLNLSRSKKTDMIAHVLKKYPKIPLNQVVMVGDKHHDIDGAKANNIDSIGITYGFGSTAEIQSAAPTYIAQSMEALVRVLLDKY
jgi:phosphoglycolate phosphatase